MPFPSADKAFTLLELLVSLTLVALVSVLLVAVTNSTASTWRYTTSQIEQFRGARDGFEAITRRLSQATLNTYWDYDDPAAPTKYLRKSDLRFIAGPAQNLFGTVGPHRPTQALFFQAPLGFVDDAKFVGLPNLLNTWGYYVEFNKDTRPSFVDGVNPPIPYRSRYRLMEMMQPSNELSIYQQINDPTNPAYGAKTWFTDVLSRPSPPVHVLAENVIAAIFLPKLATAEDKSGAKLAPNYSYDSTTSNSDPLINPKNQLPPVVQVTLVAMDETSANRLITGPNIPDFDTALAAGFSEAANFEKDLAALESELAKRKVNFRVFTTNVSLRGAKWSRN